MKLLFSSVIFILGDHWPIIFFWQYLPILCILSSMFEPHWQIMQTTCINGWKSWNSAFCWLRVWSIILQGLCIRECIEWVHFMYL